MLLMLSSLHRGPRALQAMKVGMSQANGPLCLHHRLLFALQPLGANAPLSSFAQGSCSSILIAVRRLGRAAFGSGSKLKHGSLALGQANSAQVWRGFYNLPAKVQLLLLSEQRV